MIILISSSSCFFSRGLGFEVWGKSPFLYIPLTVAMCLEYHAHGQQWGILAAPSDPNTFLFLIPGGVYSEEKKKQKPVLTPLSVCCGGACCCVTTFEGGRYCLGLFSIFGYRQTQPGMCESNSNWNWLWVMPLTTGRKKEESVILIWIDRWPSGNPHSRELQCKISANFSS